MSECKRCDSAQDQCSYCGCCQHTKPSDWCKVNDAPWGMNCPSWSCGCEGKS